MNKITRALWYLCSGIVHSLSFLLYFSFFQYYPNYDQPDSDWGKITALVDSHNNYDLIGFKLVFLGTDNILGDERPVNVRNLKVEVCLGML